GVVHPLIGRYDLGGQMYQKYFHGMINWISGGAASAALAVFVLIPSIDGLDYNLKIISLCMLVMCMPLFVATSALCKNIEATNKTDRKESNVLGFLFIPALLLLALGYGILFLAIDIKLAVAYLVACAWIWLVCHFVLKSKS
ncbi:hypothetical protein AB2359_17745, partial [Vibrio cholerae]|uniref:hypothetical protein n=1 Tax=Vibrio cholerae TaxID=666 RepID=UPI003F960E20